MPIDKDLSLTEQFEGLVLYAYDDADGHDPHPPVMPGDVVKGTLTIGYGHTGPDVVPGMTITAARAQELLALDIQSAEQFVQQYVEVQLTPNQFDALVDFVYNVGEAAFKGSTLLSLVNECAWEQAADQFGRWVNGPNGVSPGLVRRRAAEKALFLKP